MTTKGMTMPERTRIRGTGDRCRFDWRENGKAGIVDSSW
jgi:hypothetical protein